MLKYLKFGVEIVILFVFFFQNVLNFKFIGHYNEDMFHRSTIISHKLVELFVVRNHKSVVQICQQGLSMSEILIDNLFTSCYCFAITKLLWFELLYVCLISPAEKSLSMYLLITSLKLDIFIVYSFMLKFWFRYFCRRISEK